MYPKKRIVLLSLWLALVHAPLRPAFAADGAQASAPEVSGSISGRVKNAVTGQYLNRVRVTVKGTDQIAFTDDFGIFRLVGVRSGPAVLQVFYTDLDAREVEVQVPPGGIVERNIELTSAARYGGDTGIVKLDAFTVATNKETDADAIATNEQRFAPNIKNVIATDALGDVVGASAGDFLKYLPGLAAEYDNAEVQGVSIRGIGAALTAVEIDGAPTVTSGHGGASRAVNLIPQSINNLARIEVTKVPTPSTPADALAGSVNMISKTAFERSRAELRYGVNLTGNVNHFTLRRTPHPFNDSRTYKVMPGFDLDYTLPLGPNFGIVLTAMSNSTFNSQNITTRTWNAGGTATGASFDNPYLRVFGITTAPRHRSRSFYGFKADWRVTPNSVLTVGARLTKTTSARTGFLNMSMNAGTVGTPRGASGPSLSYGPGFTEGAAGRGSSAVSGSRQLGEIDGQVFDANYRFDNGRWKVTSSLNYGWSQSLLNPGADGPFSGTSSTFAVPVRIRFNDIGAERPGAIQGYDNSGREVDLFDISNYRMTTAGRNIRDNVAISRFAKLDVGRRLDVFPFPSTVQIGGLYRSQERDRRQQNETWTFVGTNHSPVPYLARVYTSPESNLGFRNVPSLSAVRAYAAYKADPSLLTKTPRQLGAAETYRLSTSEHAREAVSSFYLQAEARLFSNRLHVLTGVRYERTETGGEGPLYDPTAVFARNANGTFARDARGNRIRKPEAGAVGSFEEAGIMRKERAYVAQRSYGGYYPSLHFNYNIKENLIARLAYAKTYGRPDFANIIPSATISERDLQEGDTDDPNIVKGDISVRNTGLKPWTAQNYDLSLEYYTDQGGLFSAGVFRKDITDFFGTKVKIAEPGDLQALGLDSRYAGWNLNTKFNSGDARISGIEFNARHSLRRLGTWGRYFTVFANATRLKLEGNPHASFTSFVPRTVNWGFSFNYKRVTFTPRWNYRGLNKLTAIPSLGPDAFTYIKERLILDLSFGYRLTKRLSLAGSVGNVLNDRLTHLRYGSDTPAYARLYRIGDYGTAFSLGIKGTY